MYVTFLAHHRYDCAVDVLVILQTESSTSPPASPSRFRLSSPSTRGIIIFSSVSCRLCCRRIRPASSHFPTKLFFNVVRDARGDFGQYGGALLLERTSRPTSLFADLTSSLLLPSLHLFLGIYLSCLLRRLSSLPRFVCTFDLLSVLCLSWMIGA